MKLLSDYKKNGYHWRIIMRVGDVAMAEADRGGFEVFRVQSHQGREIAGKWCEPAEYPPSNEQWGSKGWSYQHRADADVRFCKEAEPTASPNPMPALTPTHYTLSR